MDEMDRKDGTGAGREPATGLGEIIPERFSEIHFNCVFLEENATCRLKWASA